MANIIKLLKEHISLLRIDSIVWQAGQILEKEKPNQSAARRALLNYFEDVGIEEQEGKKLTKELTEAMDE